MGETSISLPGHNGRIRPRSDIQVHWIDLDRFDKNFRKFQLLFDHVEMISMVWYFASFS